METMSLREAPSIVTCVMKDGTPHTSEIFHISEQRDFELIKVKKAFDMLVENELEFKDLASVHIQPVKSDGCIYVTEHAFERMKERAGWNRSASLRMAGKVYERGKRLHPDNAQLKKWFRKQQNILKGRIYGQEYIKYGEYLFIFQGNVLITMYQMDVKHLYDNDTRSYKHRKNEQMMRIA